MELSPEIRESIGEYISKNLRAWFDESVFGGYVQRDIEIRDRMVRVEEELKNQSDLIRTGFERVDARFAEQREESEKRISEQRDQIDRRFTEQREDSDRRFSEQREDFISRFDRIDERFMEQREDVNRRFAEQHDTFNARFDEMHRHNNRWMTVLSIVIGLTGIAVTLTNLIA